ncbi:hypothetical protein [Macrococcoides caseolyticum]|uniref:hypothetical protein n=1 Tax=Macrococcoides caseolyticum TaxID=69966 RepID=UPI001F45E3C1|nr:hypothetical protein [Macrococcus caseolyticus]MCE4956647.1 hypothetical protein [Macrococcus caseolyticus]
MKKSRGLKRKFKSALYDYNESLNNYNGYIELYVPQINYVNENISGQEYQIIDFLIKNTKYSIPESAAFMYIIDEINALNSHLILSDDNNDLNLNLIQEQSEKIPNYIKQLESKYNLKFTRKVSVTEMNFTDYVNLDEEDKFDILYYIKKDKEKVIFVTNVLWTWISR